MVDALQRLKRGPSHLDELDVRAMRAAMALAAAVFVLLATWMQPWRILDRGAFSSDFFDVQARAILHGHLNVPPRVASLEGFVMGNKTHLYFGLGPVLLRLPFAWATVFDGRLTLVSQATAVAILARSTISLVRRSRDVLPLPTTQPSRLVIGSYGAATALCTPILFLASRPVVYHEAELWGAAASLAGLDLVLRWWLNRTRANLVLAAVVAAFAISCRPTAGAAPAIALGLCGLVLLRREPLRGLSVALVAAVSTLGFAAPNWLRFGSFFGLPLDKQVFTSINAQRRATLAANDGSLFGARFIPTNLSRYLSPWAVEPTRLFPFTTWAPPARALNGTMFDTIDYSGSIITSAPVFFVLALIGGWVLTRRVRSPLWWVFAVATVVSVVPTFTIAFMAHRYLSDLVPAIVILSVPGLLCLNGALAAAHGVVRRVALTAVAVLALLGAGNQLGLTLSARAFSTKTGEPDPREALAFTRLQYRIDRWLFDGRPPHVYEVSGSPGRDHAPGDIALVDDCAGTYRFSGERWFPLERAARTDHGAGTSRRFVIGVPVRLAPGLLVTGDDWRIEVIRRADTFAIDYRNGANRVTTSEFMPLPEDEIELDIIADPLVGEVSVRYQGRHILREIYQRASGARLAGAWPTRARPATFCESLRRDMGSRP